MAKSLLIAVGLANLAFALFHGYLGYEIYLWTALPGSVRGFMQALNAGAVLMMAFLAFVCLFMRQGMLETRLGGAVLALGALLYLSRAGEEFFWFSFRPAIFYTCLAVGLLHLGLMFFVRAAPVTVPDLVKPSLLDMAPEPAAPEPVAADPGEVVAYGVESEAASDATRVTGP
ncbi:MAG: hypothetical protein KGJ78_01940 [Alphaproteobacteria bacterium]|nr:hypothetical protein [Alphaproteobacteria bacterium]